MRKELVNHNYECTLIQGIEETINIRLKIC